MNHALAALPIGVFVLATAQHHGLTSNEKAPAGELVKVVREATERFQDVEVAKRATPMGRWGSIS